MNLMIITINNAQMQAVNEAKFKDAQMTMEKENLEKGKLKGKKKMPCVVTAKMQLISSMKSQTLNKKKSFQDSDHRRANERFLTGLETR